MILCALLHKWSVWGNAYVNNQGHVVQSRWCHRCRKADVRLVSYEKINPADDYI